MKVLSIDFNYIMSTCIKLYRHLCGEENTNWERIEYELDIERFLCYDGEILKQLAFLIRKNITNGAKIFTIEQHKEIVDIINDFSKENEKVDITNIDWFHDIAGSKEEIENVINFDKYSNTNWIGYLQLKKKLGAYTWVKASNSPTILEEIIEQIDLSVEIANKFCIPELDNDYNIICVSFSPAQVPYKYKHLFDLITME